MNDLDILKKECFSLCEGEWHEKELKDVNIKIRALIYWSNGEDVGMRNYSFTGLTENAEFLASFLVDYECHDFMEKHFNKEEQEFSSKIKDFLDKAQKFSWKENFKPIIDNFNIC